MTKNLTAFEKKLLAANDEFAAADLAKRAELTNSQDGMLEVLREEGPTFIHYNSGTDTRACQALVRAKLAFVVTSNEYGTTYAAE